MLTPPLTTNQMLMRLQNSGNALIAMKARAILDGEIQADEELKYCGGFLKAVLQGNYEEAINRADDHNLKCLTEEPILYTDFT